MDFLLKEKYRMNISVCGRAPARRNIQSDAEMWEAAFGNGQGLLIHIDLSGSSIVFMNRLLNPLDRVPIPANFSPIPLNHTLMLSPHSLR